MHHKVNFLSFFFFLDMCDPGLCQSCDALIVLGFMFSLLPIFLVPTVPLIYTLLKKRVLVCCKKCEEVFRLSNIIMTVALTL